MGGRECATVHRQPCRCRLLLHCRRRVHQDGGGRLAQPPLSARAVLRGVSRAEEGAALPHGRELRRTLHPSLRIRDPHPQRAAPPFLPAPHPSSGHGDWRRVDRSDQHGSGVSWDALRDGHDRPGGQTDVRGLLCDDRRSDRSRQDGGGVSDLGRDAQRGPFAVPLPLLQRHRQQGLRQHAQHPGPRVLRLLQSVCRLPSCTRGAACGERALRNQRD
mmetsp:Transcript_17745/g.42887  ORF Transcript_17745/g.42887 Transcript_17745/m.42887 type:complete len:217 (+) Transcript_17745:552-1202(+)